MIRLITNYSQIYVYNCLVSGQHEIENLDTEIEMPVMENNFNIDEVFKHHTKVQLLAH